MAKDKATKQSKGATPNAEPRPTPTLGWRIQQLEYDARVERIRAELARRELDALVLFNPIRMAYVSGFFHLSTERPMAIVVPSSGGLGALIPQLEQEHIAKSPGVTTVKVYPEYPTGGTKHPMFHLADLISEMGLNLNGKRIGYDSNGALRRATATMARSSPRSSTTAWPRCEARDIVDKLRAVKSEAELAFITESVVWGNLGPPADAGEAGARPQRDRCLPRGSAGGDADDDRGAGPTYRTAHPHLGARPRRWSSITPARIPRSRTGLQRGAGCAGAMSWSPARERMSAATSRSWSAR